MDDFEAASKLLDVPESVALRIRIDELSELLAQINLYISPHVWGNLTTRQKELFADCLDEQREPDDEPVERPWRDETE